MFSSQIKSLLMALFLIIPSQVLADGVIDDLQKRNPDIDKYEFTKAYIDSLGDVGNALSRFKTEDAYSQDFVQSTIEMMQDTKISTNDYKRAASKIKDYTVSKNETIALMAKAIIKVYENHVKLNDESVILLEEIYSPNNLNNPSKVDLGKLMSRQADLGAQHNEIMRFLMQTSIFITQMLVSPRTDSNGKISTMGITSTQRTDLLKELEINFGEKVKKGFNKDIKEMNYFESSGAILYEFLANSEFKTLVTD